MYTRFLSIEKGLPKHLHFLISIYNKLNLTLGVLFLCYDMWYDQFQRIHYYEHIMEKNGAL